MLYSIEGLRKDTKINKIAGDKEYVIKAAFESYKNFSLEDDFDIFLSYRSLDADVAVALANSLKKEFGYKVYLDRWIDSSLNPASANRETAECIRNRLRHSKCLIYANTINSSSSKWMPWEAGFMDGQNKLVAVLPIEQNESEAKREEHKGLEYLSLYPYVSRNPGKRTNKMRLWINDLEGKYCRFDHWLRKGEKPYSHSKEI